MEWLRLWAESAAKKGSTFHVVVPRRATDTGAMQQ